MYYVIKIIRYKEGITHDVMGQRRVGDVFEVIAEHKTLDEAKSAARMVAPKEFAREADELIICKAVSRVKPVVDVMDYEEKITPELLTEEMENPNE